MNVTSIKAKLIAIRISLIPAMERDDTHNVTIVTDSITAANKILELHVNPFQNIALSLASNIKSFLDRDRRNSIHFWYYPSKAKWSRYKLIDDQVKMANDTLILFNKNSFLFSKKKECNKILKEWQTLFLASQKKGQSFLNFEDEKEQVIKPTYAKGGSWLLFIGFTNSLCAWFTCMTTGHTPIGEYHQRFFLNLSFRCPCGKVEVQTHKYIIMQCSLHKQSTRSCNTVINSFVHFLADNPSAFSFDNGWPSLAAQPKKGRHAVTYLQILAFFFSLLFFLFFPFSLSHSLSYLSRSFVSTTACLPALCNKLLI